MTLNPPPGHRERARRGKGCVYACCFAGAQGMGRSHGRLVHIGPGAMGAVTTKKAKCTISPTKPWSLGAHWTGRHGRCDDENGQVHDFAYFLTTAMTSNPPPGHRERARRGKGCVYACCFAGAQGMGRSHGRLVHIGPGAMGAVTTKTAKCTISPSF